MKISTKMVFSLTDIDEHDDEDDMDKRSEFKRLIFVRTTKEFIGKNSSVK